MSNRLNRLWVELSTEKIGFYTQLNAADIPESYGVYAWYYPINIFFNSDDDKLDDQLKIYKKIISYNTSIQDDYVNETTIPYKWDPLKLKNIIKKDSDAIYLESNAIKAFDIISKMDKDIKDSTKEYLMLGTLLTRPLYVGMAQDLSRRYSQHISNCEKGTFNYRFSEHMRNMGLTKEIKDLLYICIPFADYKENESKDEDLYNRQKCLIESILKVVGQPIFSDR